MLKILKKLFSRSKVEAVFYQHHQLGKLRLDRHDQTWETENSDVYHGGIPSLGGLPCQKTIDEINLKLTSIDKYWEICSPDLELIVRGFDSMPKDIRAKEMFKVSALSFYQGYWELGFETVERYKWFYIGMQFEGEELVSNTIDT